MICRTSCALLWPCCSLLRAIKRVADKLDFATRKSLHTTTAMLALLAAPLPELPHDASPHQRHDFLFKTHSAFANVPWCSCKCQCHEVWCQFWLIHSHDVRHFQSMCPCCRPEYTHEDADVENTHLADGEDTWADAQIPLYVFSALANHSC